MKNKILTATEVIEKLIKLTKTIKDTDNLAKELNLIIHEYVFYFTLAENNTVYELMGKEKLRELAVVWIEAIHGSVSLGWANKESAQ